MTGYSTKAKSATSTTSKVTNIYAASCADLTKSGLIAGSNLAKFGTLTVSDNSNDLSSHGDPMQRAQIMDDDCSTHWHSYYYTDSWVNYKFNKEQKVAKVAIKVRQREFFFLSCLSKPF